MIINMGLTPAIAGHSAGAPQSIAKAGLIAMTKHIALEYRGKNIRANTLALGKISTEATLHCMTVSERKNAVMENLMRRWGDPRQVEVARIAAIVASQQFAIATGNTIVFNDGTVTL